MLSKKVILTGSFGVGKTSLFNRFIFSRFSDKYLTTIGVKVNKKTININGRELSMLLWDIAGEVKQDKVPTSYFLGASGVIYVFDLTRPSTFKNIAEDLDYLNNIIPNSTTRVVGNKLDLLDQPGVDQVKAAISRPWDILTSAKTGENVEDLFHDLGKELISELV
ncbi:MAG: GTP-binding protein [Saprospiraceae bacterium]|nr:GTP-binding protein [Saprospiraceae bacterium]